MSPFLLLAGLSSEPVQRQIKSKTFSQDIIDSLGNRLLEVSVPVPKCPNARNHIEKLVSKVIEDRVEARELARQSKVLIVDPELATA